MILLMGSSNLLIFDNFGGLAPQSLRYIKNSGGDMNSVVVVIGSCVVLAGFCVIIDVDSVMGIVVVI